MKRILIAVLLGLGTIASAGELPSGHIPGHIYLVNPNSKDKETDLGKPVYSVVGVKDQYVHFYYHMDKAYSVMISRGLLRANGVDPVQFVRSIVNDPTANLICYSTATKDFIECEDAAVRYE